MLINQMLVPICLLAILATPVYPQSGTRSWYQILEVKGTASKQTDVFETRGTKWRVRWQKQTAEASLTVYIYDKDGKPINVVLTQKETSAESYVHKAGSFYLGIIASESYVIIIEDWR